MLKTQIKLALTFITLGVVAGLPLGAKLNALKIQHDEQALEGEALTITKNLRVNSEHQAVVTLTHMLGVAREHRN